MKKTRIPGKIADLLRMNDAQQILAEVSDFAGTMESILIVSRQADGKISLRYHGNIVEAIGLCDVAIAGLLGKINVIGGIDE